MNKELGLQILSEIMNWDDNVANNEFRWLSFMSLYKYDSYRDYLAGARFIESLATWLQQFEVGDRDIAYKYVKKKLIYFSPSEIQRLVESFFPEFVQKDLQISVSKKLNIPKHLVWSSKTHIKEFEWQTRKTLIMGLSDGARIDAVRRANAGVISNEQVAITTQINDSKWEDLIKDLEKDLAKINGEDCAGEKFSRIYLVDDFTASGTSLIREQPLGSGEYTGKLFKFAESLKSAIDKAGGECPFEDKFEVIVHHYIGTEQAKDTIESRYQCVKELLKTSYISQVRFTYGMVLKSDLKLHSKSNESFAKLCEKYYDPSIYDEHFKKSGCPDGKFGYAGCGLPVVLEHNTPNNSVPLLWAETKGVNGARSMRPLFRRRQRHTEFSG